MRKSLSWPIAAFAAVTLGLTVAPAPPAAAQTSASLSDVIADHLPSDYQARVADLGEITDGDLRQLAERVINPDDYVCEDTELLDWLSASIADWTEEDLDNVLAVLSLNLVFVDAILFPEPAAGRYFGLDGEYTNSLRRSFRNQQRFWDIDGSDIELVPAHGSVLLDVPRMSRVLQIVAELPEPEATVIAQTIAQIIDQPQYDHGDHPIFTFNAIAFSTEGQEIPGVGIPSDKIVMGDGIMEGFRAIGLGDVAPNAVLGHEYGHHIQFERNLFESPLTGPEATRRTELMADSFGAYHASHVKGDGLRWNRTRQVLETFYNVGDCAFDDPGHHGTPNQRLRAADWGNDLAKGAKRVLPTLTFARLFERKLPELVAPDAG